MRDFFSLGCFIFAVANPLNATDSINQDELKKSVVVGWNKYQQDRNPSKCIELSQITKIMHSHKIGSKASDGYGIFLKNNKRLFCKQFSDPSYYHNETTNLTSLESFIDDYKSKHEDDLPKFARYKGKIEQGDNYFLLFKQAPGHSLFDYFTHFSINDYADDIEVNQRILRIGQKIANFHIKYLQQNGDELKCYIHGDLHLGNIFYDYKSEYLTFIDYETLKGGLLDAEVDRLFNFSKAGMQPLLKEQAKTKFAQTELSGTTIFLSDEDASKRDIFVQRKLSQLDKCFDHLASGYNVALSKANLPYQITDDRIGLVKVG